MKKTGAMLLTALLLISLTGCGNKIYQSGQANAMELADFNIYTDGGLALSITGNDFDYFWFSCADSFDIEAENLQTRRGVALGDSDYEIVQQYGSILCQIDYKHNGLWQTVFDISFADFYQSSEYQKEYVVTFYAFMVNGRMQNQQGEEFISLYAQQTAGLEVYALCFAVNGGVIQEIECYTVEPG